jgi:hypothetical protein
VSPAAAPLTAKSSRHGVSGAQAPVVRLLPGAA